MKYQNGIRIYKAHIDNYFWNDVENTLIGLCICLNCKNRFSVSLEKKFHKCIECNTVLKINSDTIKTSIV